MKSIKISILILLSGIIIINNACKKSDLPALNNNPNAPKVVIPSTLLSGVEGSLAYTVGGDMSRFVSMFMQQTYGYSRQCGGYNNYVLTAQDVDGLWGNMYTSVMQNLDSLIVQSDRKGYSIYGGVARILMAYSLQITVDCWGDIPYSQAFMGRQNLRPMYDNAKGLYDSIISLCDVGIAKINDTVVALENPGAEDVMYQGDPAKWIKFAHAIKARLYIHQSKNDADKVAMSNKALAEIALSFKDNSDNAVYNFGTSETNSNPWYQFNGYRGDISFYFSTMFTNMLANNDPRTAILVDTTTDSHGNPGDYLLFYGNVNSPVEFICFDELRFITAEALLATGGSLIAIQTAYEDGIGSNMKKLGVKTADINKYIVNNCTITTANALEKIATEEYNALYLNPEVWSLWRRTNFPVLTPTLGNEVPRRLLYPQTEISYNKANTPAGTLFTPRLFWDGL